MLSETLVTSVRAEQRSANTTILKDIGVYVHTLHPTLSAKSTFKKSSTASNGLAASSTHVFAAQSEKAVIHVYSRDRGNQEAVIAFPERIHSIVLVNDGLLAIGTAEGRVLLWETFTGRLISTPTSHLQAVTSMAATSQHLISGSTDSNIHVWSVGRLLSISTTDSHEPVLSLSDHRAPITSLAIGHSVTNLNVCVSASKDNSCIVWNYHSGDRLRTILLPTAPLCLALDPCDRALYVGFENGTIQAIDLFQTALNSGSLYESDSHSTTVQASSEPFIAHPGAILGAVMCLDITYEGTSVLSGHASGKVIRWNSGSKTSAGEMFDANAPVNNLIILAPEQTTDRVRAANVVKPRPEEKNYTFTAQFTGNINESQFEKSVRNVGVSSRILEEAILEFAEPEKSFSAEEERLRKENEDLWAIVNEQRLLQKRTYDVYLQNKTGNEKI